MTGDRLRMKSFQARFLMARYTFLVNKALVIALRTEKLLGHFGN